MSLPPGKFDSRTVTLSGGEVTVRGLSFNEGREARGDDAAFVMIAFATDLPLPSVKDWADSVPAGDVAKLVDVITELSGFTEDAQKSV